MSEKILKEIDSLFVKRLVLIDKIFDNCNNKSNNESDELNKLNERINLKLADLEKIDSKKFQIYKQKNLEIEINLKLILENAEISDINDKDDNEENKNKNNTDAQNNNIKPISKVQLLEFVSSFFTDDIKDQLNLFFDIKNIKTIDELIQMNKDFNLLKTTFSKSLIDQSNDQDKSYLSELIERIDLIHKQRTLEIVKDILRSEQPENDILFANIDLNNIESISRRYRQLCFLFHPDRIGLPEFLDEISNELTTLINKSYFKLKEILNRNTENENELDEYEIRGDEYYLLVMKEEDYFDFDNTQKATVDESKNFACLAYENFKIACKIADRLKISNKQINLRCKMSLALFYAEKFLESQLIAIGVLNLIKEYKTCDELLKNQAEYLLRRVINRNKKVKLDLNKNDEQQTQNESFRTTVIMKNLNAENSFNVTRMFNDKLKKIAGGVLMTANNGLIEPSFKNDLFVKQLDNLKVRDEALLKKQRLEYSGISKIFLIGFNLGHKKKISKDKKFYKKLEAIVEILSNALIQYENKNYSQFLMSLSEPYGFNERFMVYDGLNKLSIDPNNIIKKLIEMEISPDSIAYLLNLIANALTSDRIKIENMETNRLYGLAFDILKATLEDELGHKATELDSEIGKLLKKHVIFKKKKSKKILENLHDVINEFEKHKVNEKNEKSSFTSRLSEVRIIACINMTILKLIIDGIHGGEFARNTLEKIRIFLDETNYSLNSECQMRIESIEFFIWILTGEELVLNNMLSIKEYAENAENDLSNEIQQLRTNLVKKLKEEKSPNIKAELYNELGDLYFKEAEKMYKTKFLSSFQLFKYAKGYYKKSREIIKSDKSICAIINCYLKTHYYDKVLECIEGSPKSLFLLPEYWYISGFALRKSSINSDKKLNIAESCIKESIRLETNKQNKIKFERELKVIKNLKELSVENRVNAYKEKKREFDAVNYNTCSFEKDDNSYKILSIDGGGIRGIIPSVLLCEIEKRSHLPLSKLVDMFAGTSTGSIIAAGLTLPDDTIKNKPKYYASDLIDLYRDKSSQIFGNANNILKWIFVPKYKNKSLKTEFENYFGESTIDKSLNELLIPAVNTSHLNQIQIFNRFEAIKYPTKNFKYIDVLLASTAAPSYFPSHQIEPLGHLVDGGLLANNPSKLAYEHAVHSLKINDENIKVFSFGTGIYLESFQAGHGSKGLAHWGKKIFNVVNSGIEFQTEIDLSNMLVDRHKRLQVFLNREIELDNYLEVANLINIAYEYVEELDNSEDNTLNKIVEILDRHKL